MLFINSKLRKFRRNYLKGHSFWDTEIWMYPPILVLYPDLAKLLLEYRWRRIDAAKDYATETGWSGVRWVKTRTKGLQMQLQSSFKLTKF